MTPWFLNALRTPGQAAGATDDSELYGLATTVGKRNGGHTGSIVNWGESPNVTLEGAILARAMLAQAIEDTDQMRTRFETVDLVSPPAFTASPLSDW